MEYTLSAAMARDIAVSEHNEIGRAIRTYLFRMEDEMRRTHADVAARLQAEMHALIGALQRQVSCSSLASRC